MATFDDVKTWINTATMQDLNNLMGLVKARRNLIGLAVGYSFSPGDKVKFDAGARGIIHGEFVKQNQKNAKVKADSGAVWTVSPHLLELDE